MGGILGKLTDDLEHRFDRLKDDLGESTKPLWRLIRKLSYAQMLALYTWLGEEIARHEQNG